RQELARNAKESLGEHCGKKTKINRKGRQEHARNARNTFADIAVKKLIFYRLKLRKAYFNCYSQYSAEASLALWWSKAMAPFKSPHAEAFRSRFNFNVPL